MAELITEEMRDKWAPIVEGDEEDFRPMSKADQLTRLLENQDIWNKQNRQQLMLETAASGNSMGTGQNIATWAPVLIKMVKRIMPNLVATDFYGTQPLSTPDGLIFAMRARYGSQTGDEAFYQEIKSGFSGDRTVDAGSIGGFPKDFFAAGDPAVDPVFGHGADRAVGELWGTGTGAAAWNQMSLSIEKQSVSAKTRGLYADYTHELRQDMMAVHGENVDNILSDMLVTEIQAEMNREMIRTMNIAAKLGAVGATKRGLYNLQSDSDGRWLVERLKGMMFQLELDANAIALDSRRGKGNRILCSPNVASALAMAGLLDYSLSNLDSNKNVKVDPTGQTYAGVLANGMQIYIDPYANHDYYTVAYKGPTEMDAGLYFAPYTPLEMSRAVGEQNFNPRMAFKTRYALAANPFYAQDAAGVVAAGKGMGQSENGYFMKAAVRGLTTV